jgi:tetratricopeptide (TPR) repeat protein
VSSVAFSAHLGGYAFGFAASLALLAGRALPRNQFDVIALWSRAGRRRGWQVGSALSRPVTARPVSAEDLGSRPLDETALTPIERLREDVAARLADRDPEAALQAYGKLLELDPKQVLSASQQIEIANHLAQTRRHEQAADAYEAFLGAYPTVADAPEVRLFLGLICSRYLQQPKRALAHLQRARTELRLEAQRALAEEELRRAEAQISGPSSESPPAAQP